MAYDTLIEFGGQQIELPKCESAFSWNIDVLQKVAKQAFPRLHDDDALANLIDVLDACKRGLTIGSK